MMCFVALVFSYVLLMLFRYAIEYVIWIISIGVLICLFAGTTKMLMLYSTANLSDDLNDQNEAKVYLSIAIAFAIATFVFGLLLILLRKRIALVAQLFKEASKALADVPMIVVEPILTFVALVLALVTFVYFVLVILSAGTLEVRNDYEGNFRRVEYVVTPVMICAHVVNLIAYMWFTEFIVACQNFVIASTVSQWYFTRDKSKLNGPIARGFSHLINFHLGSVCLGALLITVMKVIRTILQGIKVSSSKTPMSFRKINFTLHRET